MKYEHGLKSIPDDELLRRLTELLQKSRRIESELVAHIGEVDERKLYLREAFPSMFEYSIKVLGLSEAEAYLRINVARAARKHPMLLEMLGCGRLHLSGIAKLAPYLNEANREELLARASGMTKRQLEELVAEISPKPDVPTTMRKLPVRQKENPNRAESAKTPNGDGVSPTPILPPISTPAITQPLSPARYRIQFTASAELHDKLEQLRARMRTSIPDGDISSIIDDAVTEKLERLESKRFGKTDAPRKNLDEIDTSASSRYIPAAVRRAVYERDGGQCAFVDKSGRRCTHRDRLEFHHRKPYGRGGDHSLDNVQLLCHGHNGFQAELDYGKEAIERHRRSAHRVSEPEVSYTIHLEPTPPGQSCYAEFG